MNDVFVRKLSGLEAFFVDLDACGSNMTFHFYLKLDKEPSLDELNRAWHRLLETHGEINLKYKNDKWYKSDCIPECTLKHIDETDLYSYKPTRLDYKKHTIALSLLHIVPLDEWHLCFDFFHGAIDGRSGIQFVYDFFEVLNGNTPSENDFRYTVSDIIRTEKTKEKKTYKNEFTVLPECQPSSWVPNKVGEAKTLVFRTHACAKAVAAKLVSAVGKCFNRKGAKVIVPVDIRRYATESKKSLFGNLIVPLFINADHLRKTDELHTEIIDYVKHKNWLAKISESLSIYCKFSPKLRHKVINFFLPIVLASKKFIYCAHVSPLGTFDHKKLESKNFNVDDVAVTFISFPFAAFTVISLQFKEHTNTTVAWNSGRVPDEVASMLVENIKDCIVSKQ